MMQVLSELLCFRIIFAKITGKAKNALPVFFMSPFYTIYKTVTNSTLKIHINIVSLMRKKM